MSGRVRCGYRSLAGSVQRGYTHKHQLSSDVPLRALWGISTQTNCVSYQDSKWGWRVGSLRGDEECVQCFAHKERGQAWSSQVPNFLIRRSSTKRTIVTSGPTVSYHGEFIKHSCLRTISAEITLTPCGMAPIKAKSWALWLFTYSHSNWSQVKGLWFTTLISDEAIQIQPGGGYFDNKVGHFERPSGWGKVGYSRERANPR